MTMSYTERLINNRKKSHKQRLKSYGLSVNEHKNEIEKRESRCDICGTKSDLVIDHCHNTNMVRGLLCGSCNTALGFLKDSSIIARKAAKYLDTFYESPEVELLFDLLYEQMSIPDEPSRPVTV